MSISNLYNEAIAPNLYYDDYFDVDAINLLLGEYYATVGSSVPTPISTVLSSSCMVTCILTEHFFDVYPRKLYFFPYQGKVKVKNLIRLCNGSI
jgi:hypothetical protein